MGTSCIMKIYLCYLVNENILKDICNAFALLVHRWNLSTDPGSHGDDTDAPNATVRVTETVGEQHRATVTQHASTDVPRRGLPKSSVRTAKRIK